MNKKESEELTSTLAIADLLVHIRTLEKLLISKGVFTQEEFNKEMEDMIAMVAKSILQNAQVKGDIDEMINSLRSAKPKPPVGN